VTKYAVNEVVRGDPLEFPAVKAWRELSAEPVGPGRVEIRLLKRKSRSAIYRLAGVGPRGSVIAKRCRPAAAAAERAVYEGVLAHLPVTALRCYGSVGEGDASFCWLFLEDGGGEEYSPQREEHRVLAAGWLGLLHTSATRVAAAARLPDRGPGHYLGHLRSARAAILGNLTNGALSPEDRALLRAIVSQCDALESRWDQVQRACDRMPRTLVHGDLVVKNVNVRPGPPRPAFLAFDWETAGWGVPVPDLVQTLLLDRVASVSPDIPAYWATVRESWPHLAVEDIRRLAGLGSVFRLLAMIDWLSLDLAYPWVSKPLAGMRIYQAELARAVQAAL
jgi:Phosphotransferase enzyme family